MTTSFEPALSAGAIVQGKWNKAQYRVERLLGEGANGKVYLVRFGKQLYALKMGYDALDHQSEVNALKALSKSPTSFSQYLLDVDDFHMEGTDYPFCVVKYIRGQTLGEFLRQNGSDWIRLVGLNLLRKLTELHSQGYIFGDLKLENMIVTGYGDVELIDFGGVTEKGRSVKQFTEVYDRGFWGAGSRKAEESYDLFSFAVLLLASGDTERKLQRYSGFLPQNRQVDLLLEMLGRSPSLAEVAPLIRRMLQGEYATSKQAMQDWRKISLAGKRTKLRGQIGSWLKICFFASLALFAAALFMVFQ
ncbi:serine/threonine protein kinase [Paenibacillus sp. GD4]|uniref:protein kinase domain-containing protein n=1 Tax=Paenibacillus sp. GD4 TaxID=3068890 RepID=UPI002796994F|nr:serine/threonine protein kinase [Paenibacillus sp. GD4]MDQ1910932.1 serine/threonine protein kinase [Paenibacillus sp. GD4]